MAHAFIMRVVALTLGVFGISATAIAGPAAVDNGSQFAATDGSPVQAHGAGIIKVGNYYYLLGENRNGYLFKAVSMYRSTDLKTWEFRNDILTPSSNAALNPSNIERPKVIYNPSTRKYVLWAHKENGKNYNEARVVVATSDTVDGDYTYLGDFRPLNYDSRDMTVYVDDDGTAYLISSSSNNYDLNIYKLNASYTGIDSLVTVIKGNHREAPAVFKRNGVYFLITSGATGWNPNQAAYQTAGSMAGPWTSPAPFGDSRTYNSQSTYVQPVRGANGTSWLYLGDQWGPAFGRQPNDSTYVWLPLTFPSNTSVAMAGGSQITIDASSGKITNNYSGTTLVQLKARSSNLCLNVAGDALGYGSPIQQYGCNGYANMKLETRPVGGGYVQYVFQSNGLCLAQKNGDTYAVATSCGGGARTQWSRNGGQVVNRDSGRCLNVSGDSHAQKAKIITYPCSSSANSLWDAI